MNDYSKKVFSNPMLLRQKLGIYLQTPNKVEIYAKTFESFFIAGERKNVKFIATWSWWAFLFSSGFFIYRKVYLPVFIVAISNFLTFFNEIFIGFVIWFGLSASAKYLICKRFIKFLDMQNDDILKQKGGTHNWVAYTTGYMLYINNMFNIALYFATK